jgi:hypothetical protein
MAFLCGRSTRYVRNEANGDSSLVARAIPQTAGENEETADTIPAIRTVSPQQHLEQMYQLAEVFAAIFETLPDGTEAVSSIEKAA